MAAIELERKVRLVPHFMRVVASVLLVSTAMLSLAANAQSVVSPPGDNQRQYNAILDIANTYVVGMLGGSIGSLRSRMIVDIGTVIDRNPKFRIVPILGKSAEQNIDDLFLLRGVDIILAQSDALAARLGREGTSSTTSQMRYISRLHSEEVHIIARDDIRDIRSLEGKFVNFGLAPSGTPFTATNLFRRFGINVLPIYVSHAKALQMLREDRIAATIRLEGKPDKALTTVAYDDGLRLLDVPLPRNRSAGYVATELTHDDYPQLIERGNVIRTVAVDIILITRNWPASSIRHVKIDNFVQEILVSASRLKDLESHPKWKQFDPVRQVRGLPRFNISPKSARNSRTRPNRSRIPSGRTGALPSATEDAEPSADELFREFQRWSEGAGQ